MEYVFTLKFQLTDAAADLDELAERLGQGGCDDALLGLGQPGRFALEFTRAGDDARAALVSALADVKAAVPEARLVEAAPDFVGLTDVADALGVSRQYMRKLMVTHAHAFPVPVHEGTTTVWHLADILAWLRGRGEQRPDGALTQLIEVAEAARQLNLAKTADQLSTRFRRAVRDLID